MPGLNICTRCRAISARRSRRISSSLLPLNIGPQMTSIQPRLPLAKFMNSPQLSAFSHSNSTRNSELSIWRFFAVLWDLCVESCFQLLEVREHFAGASQHPAADLVLRHAQHQVNGDTSAMSVRDLTLRASAARRRLIEIADDALAAVDPIQVPCNDLA